MGTVILFDGKCNLCNGAVKFILDHERGSELHFAAIQSDGGAAAIEAAVDPATAHALREGADGSGDPDSVVVIEDGRVFTHSTGALRVARHLRFPWRLAFVFILVPRPLRDVGYRWIARNRYRWFGKRDECRVPTPALRARFLD
jgi:predicted DCC family thiol-disulfide oxidoreductase YuxK